MRNSPCISCNKPLNGGTYRKPNMCPWCGALQDKTRDAFNKPLAAEQVVAQFEVSASASTSANEASEPMAQSQGAIPSKPVSSRSVTNSKLIRAANNPKSFEQVVLTAKDSGDFEILEQLGEVKVDYLFASGPNAQNRDAIIQQAKKAALVALRKKAHAKGANTVLRVQMKAKKIPQRGDADMLFRVTGVSVKSRSPESVEQALA